MRSHPLQRIVVIGSVPLEVQADVEVWVGQSTVRDEHEADQESPNATVSIKERMNGLELCSLDHPP